MFPLALYEGLTSPYLQHLLLSVLVSVILVDVRRDLNMVLIYVSLTSDDVDYLFMCLLIICMSL